MKVTWIVLLFTLNSVDTTCCILLMVKCMEEAASDWTYLPFIGARGTLSIMELDSLKQADWKLDTKVPRYHT
jgi:hypothetical protein